MVAKRKAKDKRRAPQPDKAPAFIQAYLHCRNATEAAQVAGLGASRKACQNAGFKMMQRSDVQESLAKSALQAAADSRITASAVLEALAEIAMLDPAEVFQAESMVNGKYYIRLKHITELPRHVRRCISSFKVVKKNITTGDQKVDELYEVKFWDKLQANALIAQHLGMLKVEVDLTLKVEQVGTLSDEQLEQETKALYERMKQDVLARAMNRPGLTIGEGTPP